MNSFNHYAFGSCGQYLFSCVGGISPTEPGYRQFVVAPVIGFPRGAGSLAQHYADTVGVDAVALDTAASAALGRSIQEKVPIQGALDPLLLRAGGAALDHRVDELIEQWGDGPYIFNLGHGIILDTPIAHVERVLKRITQG
jgi:uroporphyrinogen decarboxylase